MTQANDTTTDTTADTATNAATDPALATAAAAVSALKPRYEDLKARFQTTAEAVQGAMPVNELTKPQQEAFMLAVSDLQLLQTLFKDADRSFNGLHLLCATPEEIAAGGDFVASMAELAKELVETVVETFGVSADLVLPTAIKTFGTSVDLIETIVVRAEANHKAMSA